MALITTPERNKLYLKVKTECGYPLRPFELGDDELNTLLEIVIEDYSALVNDWLIHQQWISLEGLDSQNSDFLSAFTIKSTDYMESFTYAYSKQVGLGTNAPAAKGWELKRDYITTSAHTQHYILPANREINEVLWETPPEIDQGLVDPFALNAWSPGLHGWSYLGRPAMYVQPTFSTLLSAQDRGTKKRILQSLLTYRITGMADGRKILHLYPVPGSKEEISSAWGKHYAGRKVWYWYYDTNNIGRDKCLEENSDIIKLPSDPPVKVMKWENLNDSARKHVRDFLIAKAKMVLGSVRGFYSGDIGVANKELTLDYRHLLDEGKELKEATETKIIELLDKISQDKLTEERARIAENVNKERGYQPPMFPIIAI